MKDNIDYEKFLDMDKHQIFLDDLYFGRTAAQTALMMLNKIPYKGKSVRKSIKLVMKYIKDITHDIRIEEMWRGND